MTLKPFDDYPRPAAPAWIEAMRLCGVDSKTVGSTVSDSKARNVADVFQKKFIVPVCEEMRVDYVALRFRLYSPQSRGKDYEHELSWHAHLLYEVYRASAGRSDAHSLGPRVEPYHCQVQTRSHVRPHDYRIRSACLHLQPFRMIFDGKMYKVAADPMCLNVLPTPFTDDPAVQELAEILTLIPSLRSSL